MIPEKGWAVYLLHYVTPLASVDTKAEFMPLFKCWNSSEIDKYHLKTYKLVDSSNNYCCKFE